MTMTRRDLCVALTAALALAPAPALTAEAGAADRFETDRILIESSPAAGADVILLPGLATPGAVWDGLAADLKGRATVHVVNIKGFGRGDGAVNAEGGLMPGVLSDIEEFVEDRGLESPALIGHSLGGTLALEAGIEMPELFGKLMVVDALPFVGLLFDPHATVESVEPRARKMRDRMAAGPADAQARETAERYAIDPAAQARIAAWIAASDPGTMAQAFFEDMQTDLRPRLAEIGPPVTVVVPVPPEAEGRNFPERYERLYSDVPDLTLEPIAAARHFVMLDRPEATTTAVEDFLELAG